VSSEPQLASYPAASRTAGWGTTERTLRHTCIIGQVRGEDGKDRPRHGKCINDIRSLSPTRDGIAATELQVMKMATSRSLYGQKGHDDMLAFAPFAGYRCLSRGPFWRHFNFLHKLVTRSAISHQGMIRETPRCSCRQFSRAATVLTLIEGPQLSVTAGVDETPTTD